MEIIQYPHEVKARKTYVCDMCRKQIEVNEKHETQVVKEDGHLYTFRICYRCKKYVDEVFQKLWFPDGLSEECFRSYMQDNYKDIAKRWWENEYD